MLHGVILAGGVGSRFWPISTQDVPKQFLKLMDDDLSLLEMTDQRVQFLVQKKMIQSNNLWLVSQCRYEALLEKQRLSIPRDHWLLEPESKNTAAAIGWTACEIERVDPEASLLIVPSDHWITPIEKFYESMVDALSIHERFPEKLLTFGKVPTYPTVHLGYLEKGASLFHHVYEVLRFVEKPSIEKARDLIGQQKVLWHCGNFIWSVKTFLSELERYGPRLLSQLQRVSSKNKSEIYQKLEKVSIDVALLEKTHALWVMEAGFEWSDVGNWESLWHLKGEQFLPWLREHFQVSEEMLSDIVRRVKTTPDQ
ncbi:MAG: hypothetical protein HY390_06265 [Deltaproteobacteria bacterium]|nr:hypothetical protein [Deltaproteobacteria bacterium]